MNGMEEIESKITIYSNRSCSKSQCAIEVLESMRVDFKEINYLESPLTMFELKEVIRKLNCRAQDLIRTNEPIYLQKFADKKLSDDEWIMVIHENPILIQRPIIVNGNRAQIARTTDSILNILKE